MERREFIKKSCLSGLAIAGSCFLLTECKSISIKESASEIKIPASLFKGKDQLLISSKQTVEKILVVKKDAGNYHAVLMKCTHKGAELNQKGNELVCPLHGSIFDLDGNVTHAPAKQNLKTFPVTVNQSDIVVHLQS